MSTTLILILLSAAAIVMLVMKLLSHLGTAALILVAVFIIGGGAAVHELFIRGKDVANKGREAACPPAGEVVPQRQALAKRDIALKKALDTRRLTTKQHDDFIAERATIKAKQARLAICKTPQAK